MRFTLRVLLGWIAAFACLWAWLAYLSDRESAYRPVEKWAVVTLVALALPGALCLAAWLVGAGRWKPGLLATGLVIHTASMATFCFVPIGLLAYDRCFHPGKLSTIRMFYLGGSLLPAAVMTMANGLGFLLLVSGLTPFRTRPRDHVPDSGRRGTSCPVNLARPGLGSARSGGGRIKTRGQTRATGSPADQFRG